MQQQNTPTAQPARYLLDTNILLRRADSQSSMHQSATDAVSNLLTSGAFICITAQNIIEFWNVATRPKANNGLEWDTIKTATELASLRANFTFLPDTAAIFTQWQKLVSAHKVQGAQVHDTRLAAVALAYGVENILTFNGRDFRRFALEGLAAVDPTTVAMP